MEGEFTLEGTVFCQSQLAPQDWLLLAKSSGVAKQRKIPSQTEN